MVTIHIPDELARQLENQAEQANQSLEEYAVNLLQKNLTPQADDDDEVPEGEHPLDAILGMFDDDVTDMSSTVRETLKEIYTQKYGRPD